MKVNSGDIHTEVTENVDEFVFKVDDEDQGFIFEMLRSKIYSDPIAAICREISANSRDANREVLKGHVPITIGFREEHPLNGDSSLHVFFKDDGPGISPDRMANVFCKYAKSTKRDTDDQTGGFGLGAKTPFAYTDAFTIITNVDGMKYTYTAYIDESRRGKIAKLDEQTTGESNGTTIIVPIHPYDRRRFEREVVKYTSMWDTPPKYDGFNHFDTNTLTRLPLPKECTMTLKSGRVVLLVQDSNRLFSGGICMLVDGMPYECDVTQIARYKDITNNSAISGYNIVISAKTGEVDLSVNRETMQYTSMTIDYIEKALEEIRSEMVDMVNDFVSGSSSYFEACIKAWSVMNDRVVHTKDGKELNGISRMAMAWLKRYTPADVMKMFDYNGKAVVIQSPNMSHMRFQVGYFSDNGNIAYKDVDFSLLFFYTRDVYMLDTKTKSIERTSHIINTSKSQHREIILVSNKVFKPHKGISQDANDTAAARFAERLKEDIAEFENFEIQTKQYSSVPLTSKSRGKATKDEVITVSVREFKITRYGSKKDWLTPKKLTVRRQSGPVDKDGNDIQHEVMFIETADIVKCDEVSGEKMRVAALIMEYYKMKMYVVPKRLSHHFKDCLDIDTAISSFDVAIVQKIVNANAIIDMNRRVQEFGLASIHISNQKLVVDIKALFRRAMLYGRLKLMKSLRENELIGVVATYYKLKSTADLSLIESYMENFGDMYPLLKDYSSFRHSPNKDAINQYIKLMDMENARIEREKKREEKLRQASTVPANELANAKVQTQI